VDPITGDSRLTLRTSSNLGCTHGQKTREEMNARCATLRLLESPRLFGTEPVVRYEGLCVTVMLTK